MSPASVVIGKFLTNVTSAAPSEQNKVAVKGESVQKVERLLQISIVLSRVSNELAALEVGQTEKEG